MSLNPNQHIRYFITDAYGRTICPRHDFASADEARKAALGIDCVCGVWLCPAVYEEGDGWVDIDQDEEIKPELVESEDNPTDD